MAVKKNININSLDKEGTSDFAKSMVGHKYGRVLVLFYVGDKHYINGCKTRQAIVVGQCDCGAINTYIAGKLRSNWTSSCGCLQAELSATNHTVHGHKPGSLCRGSKLYSTWQSIKQRCKTNLQYISLGIKVSDEWSVSFETFAKDMGDRPTPEYTLERVDNTKGYCKENCKWATRVEQGNNTRRNKFIVIDGDRMTLSEAKRRHNIGHCKAKRIYIKQNPTQ